MQVCLAKQNQTFAKIGFHCPVATPLISLFSNHHGANGVDDYASLIDPTRLCSLSLKGSAQCQEANHGDRQSHRADRGPRSLSRGSLQLQQRRVRAVVPGRYSPDPQPGAGQSRVGALLHPGRLRRAGPVVALLSHLISPEG